MRDPEERIDEIKTSIDNLRADFEDRIERLEKERDDWRELYEGLVEKQTHQILTALC